MAAQILPEGKQHFDDAAGAPLSGGKLFTYATGTLTPLATYSDPAGTVPNANPVVLDTRGEAIVYWALGAAYRVILQDSAGNVIWPALDGIGGTASGLTLAGILAAGLRFRDLPDAFASFAGKSLQTVRVNVGETALEPYTPAAVGATNFRALTDTFASFAGKANQVVIVNAGETALTTDGNTLGDASYKMASTLVLTGGVPSTLNLNVSNYDQLKRGTWSTTTFLYTAGGTGARILLSAQAMANITNGESLELWIEKNSATDICHDRNVNELTSASGNYWVHVTSCITLAAGDTVRLRIQCTASRTVDNALGSTQVSIVELG